MSFLRTQQESNNIQAPSHHDDSTQTIFSSSHPTLSPTNIPSISITATTTLPPSFSPTPYYGILTLKSVSPEGQVAVVSFIAMSGFFTVFGIYLSFERRKARREARVLARARARASSRSSRRYSSLSVIPLKGQQPSGRRTLDDEEKDYEEEENRIYTHNVYSISKEDKDDDFDFDNYDNNGTNIEGESLGVLGPSSHGSSFVSHDEGRENGSMASTNAIVSDEVGHVYEEDDEEEESIGSPSLQSIMEEHPNKVNNIGCDIFCRGMGE